jgi:hypothetical protein
LTFGQCLCRLHSVSSGFPPIFAAPTPPIKWVDVHADSALARTLSHTGKSTR